MIRSVKYISKINPNLTKCFSVIIIKTYYYQLNNHKANHTVANHTANMFFIVLLLLAMTSFSWSPGGSSVGGVRYPDAMCEESTSCTDATAWM